jgi:carbamoyl-phosphate synthase large subunit
MPRWTFEKFPEADETLTTQMKSVGEAMAIGRTLKESLQKVIRSMDVKRFGLGLDKNDKWLTAMRAVERGRHHPRCHVRSRPKDGPASAHTKPARPACAPPTAQPIEWPIPHDKLSRKLAVPSQGRLYYVRYAFKMGWSIEKVQALTNIDPFFLDQIQQLVQFEDTLCNYKARSKMSRMTCSSRPSSLATAMRSSRTCTSARSRLETILKAARRKSIGIEPVYKSVDTCAAEFEAITPYYYSTYERGFGSATPYTGEDESA